ncbi:ribonuclease H [Senna tora]|uniref:Ribonuclease H n=1 Tax=Senna tora TaxID=362788 RepID=A0A834WW61_9FABA|nr:ribonuclease H [Senna tora]
MRFEEIPEYSRLTCRSKYRCGDDILPEMKTSSSSSRLWRAVVRNWAHVNEGIEWRLGDGKRTKFWLDAWIPNCGKLVDLVTGPVSQLEMHEVVVDYTTPSGGWDWDRFEYRLPDQIRAKIAAVSSSFELLSARPKDLAASSPAACSFLFMVMWDNKLLTNAERVRRGMTDVASCSRCGGVYEDVLHAIRDCPNAKNLWMRLVRSAHWPEFFSSDLPSWLLLNVSKQIGRLQMDWPTTFATTCWSLWKWRNEAIFANKVEPVTDWFFTVVHRTRSYKEDFSSFLNQRTRAPSRIDKIVKWDKPELGWIKINVDGACNSEHAAKAACGGVARNAQGMFVGAFTRNLGSCSVIHAELWGVLSGLEMALHYQYRKVVIEMDSLVACELIKSPLMDSHPCAALLRDIHRRCCDVGEVVFQHVFREGNRAADAMARLAHDSRLQLSFLLSPPGDIISFLDDDNRGVGTLRSCVG